MFKDERLRHERCISICVDTNKKTIDKGDFIYGYCKFWGNCEILSGVIRDENIIKEISGEKYYYAEVTTSDVESDYHTYSEEHFFQGVFLNFDLPISEILQEGDEFVNVIKNILKNHHLLDNVRDYDVAIEEGEILRINISDLKLNEKVLVCCEHILEFINEYFKNPNSNKKEKVLLKK